MRRARLAVVIMVWTFAWQAFAAEGIQRLTFAFQNQSRNYYCFIPDVPGALPVIVLLHGSGRDGTEMIKPWQALAAKEGIILVAPNALHPAAWDTQYDPPAFLHAVVEQVSALHPVDQKRIYLFGQSGGAVFALALALVDSEYYAATAVHAGALPPEYQKLFQRATRHMPVAIWSGDRDPAFPPDRVRATKEMFEKNDFPLQLTVLPNLGHSYDQNAAKVNGPAWDFLKRARLP